MFPRTVAAHLYEIDAYDSSILTESDIQQINNYKRIIYQNEKVQINE